MLEAGSAQRGVAAWCAAWAVVALLGWAAEWVDAVLGPSKWAPSYLGAWMTPSGLAFAIWIPFARARRWARPLADISLFALGAVVAPLLFVFALALRGEHSFWPAAHADARFLDGMSAVEYALYVAQLAMAFGVLGGLLYWLFAGRPRPPHTRER